MFVGALWSYYNLALGQAVNLITEGNVVQAVALTASTLAATGVFSAASSMIGNRFFEKLNINIQKNLFDKVISKKLDFFKDKHSGEIAQRTKQAKQDLAGLTNMIIDSAPNRVFSFLSSVAICAVTDPTVLVAALAYGGVLVGSMALRNKGFAKRQKTVNKVVAGQKAKELDAIQNAPLLNYTNSVKNEKENVFGFIKKSKEAIFKVVKFQNFTRAAMGVSDIVFSTLMIGLAAYFVSTGKINAGEFITLLATSLAMSRAAVKTSVLYKDFLERKTSLKDAMKVINEESRIKEKDDAITLKVTNGKITFENIDFAYSSKDKNIFENITLAFNSGEVTAILGESGSGKTTLVNLIERIHDVTKGSIKIDEQNIKDITVSSLRKNIAYVSQQTEIMSKSILENIKIAKPNATREEVEQAAKLAGIHDVIIKKEEGYDTIIGEGASDGMSGGQQQRISLARALLANTPIVIMDEPTSGLDKLTSSRIMKDIINAFKNPLNGKPKTVLFITHDPLMTKLSDRIICLEGNGGGTKIVDDGSFAELSRKSAKESLFKRLLNGALFIDESVDFIDKEEPAGGFDAVILKDYKR